MRRRVLSLKSMTLCLDLGSWEGRLRSLSSSASVLASEGLAWSEPGVERSLGLAYSRGGPRPMRKRSSAGEELEGDWPTGVNAFRRVLRRPAGMEPGWMVSGPLILTAPLMPADSPTSHLLTHAADSTFPDARHIKHSEEISNHSMYIGLP